jgi:MerR family redox-sensitive transcriptional activator SoxR
VSLLTISQLSARSGVAASALRFYEDRGLIAAQRTESNHRRYPPDTLRRVAFIKAGVAAGISLGEIRETLASLPTQRAPPARDGARLSSRWRDDLNDRIATLEALRDRLDGCIGCGCLSLKKCVLLNPGDEAAADGPGARYLRRPGLREQRSPAQAR